MAELPEDSPLKTFVALVKVTDPDLGVNGNVTCHMISESKPTDLAKNNPAGISQAVASDNMAPSSDREISFAFTKTFENEYTITTLKSLDREVVEHYRLMIR